jgi:hypothetical protein
MVCTFMDGVCHDRPHKTLLAFFMEADKKVHLIKIYSRLDSMSLEKSKKIVDTDFCG